MGALQIVLVVIFLVMNVISYVAMSVDKRRAVRRGRRVPERTLFLLAALGGALGSIAAMMRKRHKTKHWSFRLGMPLLLVVNVLVYGYFM